MNALPFIAQACRTGFQIDLDHFAALDKTLTADMERITEAVHDLTGYYVNCGSGDQVADLLFKKLKLKQARVNMTKTGERESVAEEVLKAIMHDHEVVPVLLEYKELEKLRGTYVRPMPKLAVRLAANHYRIYPNIKPTRVPSGRYACADPNLLAIPSRTQRGLEVRKGFKAAAGYKYLSCDESQIEVRLAAHCSGDPGLCKVYCDPIEDDVYSDFAVTSFKRKSVRHEKEGKWVYDDVHRMDHRYPAKTCILASIYDVSPAGLVEQMPVVCKNCNWLSLPVSSDKYTRHGCNKFVALWNEQNCEQLINSFYLKYPGVLQERIRMHNRARKYAYVWDMWGRILHAAAVRSVHPWVVAAALREVGNFEFQAGSQGTIKLVMAAVWDDLLAAKMVSIERPLDSIVRPLLQIHDELLLEVREDVLDEVSELIKWRFSTCVELNVPIKAGSAVADSWGEIDK